MLLEFKTKKDINGNYLYLAIDTESREYSTFNNRMTVPNAIEIKKKDLHSLIEHSDFDDFKHVNHGIN